MIIDRKNPSVTDMQTEYHGRYHRKGEVTKILGSHCLGNRGGREVERNW